MDVKEREIRRRWDSEVRCPECHDRSHQTLNVVSGEIYCFVCGNRYR
jgi:hypothetical protein